MTRSSLRPVTLDRPGAELTALARPGEGRPIVLLHGGMADAPAWRRVIDHLEPARPLLAPNRRGRRGSADPDGSYTVETEIDDLLAWVDTISEPVDLVAHSMGGLIATEAVRRGASVTSLVLYDPVARPFADDAALTAIRRATASGDLDTVVVLINTAVSGYDEAHVARLRATGAWAALVELARPAAAELEALEAFEPHWADYAGLGVPVTLIAGEHTVRRRPYASSVAAFRRALGVDVVVLDGQDHIAHVMAPEQLADTVAAALRGR